MSQQLPQQELTELGPIPFEPGRLIHGRYEVMHLIGAGGVGFVVAARHAGFDDLVALKFLRPEFTSNSEAVTRFTIEARASFKLRSEHIVRVLDVDICEGTPFIVMELLEGTDLRGLLERCRLLDVEPSVDYMLQACEALAAAHATGVIHRDIKPENLFLLGEGADYDHLKVLDFGISKVALVSNLRSTSQALTRVAVGTPPYMSPEQVRAARDLDMRSDLWSVGCVLYELVTGMAPFERESLMQSCAAVLEEEPLPPRQLRPAIPSGLSDAIMYCLRKNPESRFADVAELAEALGPFGSGRFSAYPARCRATLNGEGPGRRSTPTALAAISARTTGHPSGPAAPPRRAPSLRAISPLTAAEPSSESALAPRKPTLPPATYQRSSHALTAASPHASTYDMLELEMLAEPAQAGSAARARDVGSIVAWTVSLLMVAATVAYLGARHRGARLLPGKPTTSIAHVSDDSLRAAPPVRTAAAPPARHPAQPPSAASKPDALVQPEPPAVADKALNAKPSLNKAKAKLAAGRIAASKLLAAASTTEEPDVGF